MAEPTTNPSPARDLKGAVIGVGKAAERTWAKGGGHKIGYFHADGINAVPGCRVTTAADIDADNRNAFLSAYGAESGYADYREMLAKEKPDIVAICTYLGLHAQMLEDCVAAGVKVILCEKPLAGSPAEIERMRKAIEGSNSIVGVAHTRRYAATFLKARELVAQGAVGDPVLYFGGLGGWDLAEFGSHWIDLMRMIHGDKPVRYVMGQARVRDGFGYGHVMEDHALAYFEFEDGCRGMVDGGRGFIPVDGSENPPRSAWDIRVVGTEGFLILTEGKEVNLYNRHGHQCIKSPHVEEPWCKMYESLVVQSEGGPESPISFARCAPSAEIFLAAYLSAVRCDRIDFPLSAEIRSVAEWPLNALVKRA